MEKATACRFCINAYIDDELEDDKDLSYSSLGECESGYRIFFRTGDRRPTELLVQKYHKEVGWCSIGHYQPQYCPNCGRKLIENKAPKE